MAEKSFGIKELNLIGASGTPSIDSPNNLNLNAVNVAISTNVSIGGTLTVTGNVSVGGTLTYEDVTNIDSVGLITARNGLNVTAGVSTFAAEIHGNNQRLGSLSSSGRFNGLFLNDGTSYYGSNKLFVSSGSGFGLEAYGDMDAYLRSNRGGGTDGNCYMMTGSSSGGYVFVNGDNGVEIHHAGTSNKKFETTSSGATVTGTLTATTFSGSGASLTNLPATDPTNSDIQVVYAVTANGSSAYRFGGNGIVSTEDNPDVYLIRGLKYRFINNSGGSHPFQIRVSNGGSAYSSGVTNNGASSGNIDFQVPYSAPSHLYYQCTSHGGMVGNLYIRGAGGNNTNVGVTTFSGGITVSGNTSFAGGNVTMTASGSPNSLNVSGTARIEIASIENAYLDGSISHTGDIDTAISFDTDIIKFDTAGSERVRIDDDGNFLIGITGHGNASTYARNLIISGSSNRGLTIHTTDTSGSNRKACIFFGTGTSVADMADGMLFYDNASRYFHMSTAGGGTGVTQSSFRLGSDGTVRFDSTPTTVNSISLRIQSHKTRTVDDNNGIVFFDEVNHSQAAIAVQKKSTSDATSDLVFRTSSGQVVGTLQGIPERMRLTSEGYLTKPYHPAFKCAITTSQSSPNSGVVSENNGFTLNSTSSRDAFNNGGHFSEATGRFTAPVTGLYYFHFSVMRYSNYGSGSVDLRIKKNSSMIYARSYKASYDMNFESLNVTTITNMSANHYVEFVIGSNMSVYEDDSYMLGYLIG